MTDQLDMLDVYHVGKLIARTAALALIGTPDAEEAAQRLDRLQAREAEHLPALTIAAQAIREADAILKEAA